MDKEIVITIQESWERAFEDPFRLQIEAVLPTFLASSRWFGGKAKTIRSAKFADIVRVGSGDSGMMLGFIDISYGQGDAETYVIPITAAFGAEAERIRRQHANAVIVELNLVSQRHERGLLYDALWNKDCALALLASMGQGDRVQGSSGALVGSATGLFDEVAVSPNPSPISVMKGEQSNTSVKFGDRVIMKLYRRVEPGMNPELEIGRILTSRSFRNSPALVGALEYVREHDEPITLALAQLFIANEGNAWDHTLSQLSRYFGRIASLDPTGIAEPSAIGHVNSPAAPPDPFAFIDRARLLGRRTGELHRVLGQSSTDPAFSPETCSPSYLRERSHAMQRSTTHALRLLRERMAGLSDADRKQADAVLQLEPSILQHMDSLNDTPVTAMRIRCHGDYHLGQVLYTGQDFIIIDYEGEPARPLAERRSKHLPLVDLGGMIRSFHYAAHAALRQRDQQFPEPVARSLERWAEQWYRSVRAAFLRGYRAVVGEAPFSPQSQQEFNLLLDLHLLDKAIYELSYELNNRPNWVALPLMGILQCMDGPSSSGNQDEWGEGGGDSRDTERPNNEVNR